MYELGAGKMAFKGSEQVQLLQRTPAPMLGGSQIPLK